MGTPHVVASSLAGRLSTRLNSHAGTLLNGPGCGGLRQALDRQIGARLLRQLSRCITGKLTACPGPTSLPFAEMPCSLPSLI